MKLLDQVGVAAAEEEEACVEEAKVGLAASLIVILMVETGMCWEKVRIDLDRIWTTLMAQVINKGLSLSVLKLILRTTSLILR